MFVELSGFLRVNQGTVDGANAIHALEGAAGHLLRCRDFFQRKLLDNTSGWH